MTTVYVPDFELSLEGVRIDPDTDDWLAADLGAVMVSPVVNDAAIDLYARAGQPQPAIAYVADMVGLRVAAAAFNIAGIRSSFVEASIEAAKVKTAYDELKTGKIKLLAVRRPYSAGPAIDAGAVLLCRPTRCAAPFMEFLSRLARDDVAILDLAGNIHRLGVPPGWSIEKISVPSRIVVADPVIGRLGTMSTPAAQRWAEGDRDRLVLIARAKRFKAGWVDHAEQGWADKQVRSRARRFVASEARVPP